jgi:hypothetical protein
MSLTSATISSAAIDALAEAIAGLEDVLPQFSQAERLAIGAHLYCLADQFAAPPSKLQVAA